MKYSVKYKKVFDKDGNIVDISTINEANRLSEYYSIGSHTPMTAALGEKNQHHFRAKRGYQLNPETELHEYAKRILKYRFDTEDCMKINYNRKKICPFEEHCIFYDKMNKGCGALNEELCEYDLKKYYDTATIESCYDGFVADVLLTSSTHNRKPVFLEVAVTHPCTDEKKNSGNKIIEIVIKAEDHVYCELNETLPSLFYHEGPIIKFHNKEKIYLKECPHFAKDRKYAQQPYKIINGVLPTKFYCIPQQVTGNPLRSYYDNTQIGMLFASNSYAKPFVFDKAISKDGRSFVMMGKDIYGAVKPWVIYVVSWKGTDFHYRVFSHFDYKSALKDFTILQGKVWNGGETLSDGCM